MTLAVAEALNPNKPKPLDNPKLPSQETKSSQVSMKAPVLPVKEKVSLMNSK